MTRPPTLDAPSAATRVTPPIVRFVAQAGPDQQDRLGASFARQHQAKLDELNKPDTEAKANTNARLADSTRSNDAVRQEAAQRRADATKRANDRATEQADARADATQTAHDRQEAATTPTQTINAPSKEATTDEATQTEAATDASAAETSPESEEALSSAEALALMLATGGAASAQTEVQAQVVAPDASAQAVSAANTENAGVPQAQGPAIATPAIPTAADEGLNITGLQVTTNTDIPANLTLHLAEQAEQAVEAETITLQLGSNTPALAMDEANGLELLAPAPAADDTDTMDVVTDDGAPPAVAALNGNNQSQSANQTTGIQAPTAPPQAEDVLPQVLKHAEALKSQQQNSIKLQLYPEHLGKMEIKVMAHQGVLSAQLTADNQHVKGLLETQVASLQRSLQEMGIKVDKVEVTLASADLGGSGLPDSNAFANGQGQGNGHGHFGHHQGAGLRLGADEPYGAWLEDGPTPDDVGASMQGESNTAINYVA